MAALAGRTQLLKAHRALDKAVNKLYRSAAFASDRERAEFLLGEYEKMVAATPSPMPLFPTNSRERAGTGTNSGQVAEWSIAPVLKTGVPATVPWVRIPPCP